VALAARLGRRRSKALDGSSTWFPSDLVPASGPMPDALAERTVPDDDGSEEL
jgi:hypothetical protein